MRHLIAALAVLLVAGTAGAEYYSMTALPNNSGYRSVIYETVTASDFLRAKASGFMRFSFTKGSTFEATVYGCETEEYAVATCDSLQVLSATDQDIEVKTGRPWVIIDVTAAETAGFVSYVGFRGHFSNAGSGSGTTSQLAVSSKEGFPTFDSVDGRPDLIIRAGLRSSDNDENGVGLWPGTLLSGGSPSATFDADAGMTVTSSYGLRYAMDTNHGTTETTALEAEGAVGISITSTANSEDDPASATSYAFTTNDVRLFQYSASGAWWDRLTASPGIGESLYIGSIQRNDSGFFRIFLSWKGDVRDVYLNDLLVSRVDTSDGASVWDLSNFYVGADRTNANGAGVWTDVTFRDFFILDSAQRFNRRERVLFLGDSYITNACPYAFITAGHVPTVPRDGQVVPWAPTTSSTGSPTGTNYGCGLNSSGNYQTAVSANLDQSLIPEFFRNLGRGGVWTESNGNYAEGDAVSADIDAQIDEAVAGGINPTLAVLGVGLYDAASGTDSGGFELCDGVTATAYRDNLRAAITRLYKLGVSRVVVWTIPSLANEIGPPSYASPECAATVAAYNSEINSLPSWADSTEGMGEGFVRVADVFTAFGGTSPDSDYFTSNNYTPSLLGSNLIGELLADEFI